jgi:molybdopterin molybdotransferase
MPVQHATPMGRQEATGTAHVSWEQARSSARTAATPLPPVIRSLSGAIGHALAAPLTALTDLPAFDSSAMDGWAVCGSGPWKVLEGRVLAGELPAPLHAGTAVGIATGAPVPAGTTAVLRRERGVEADGLVHCAQPLPQGQDIRPRGQECVAGAILLEAGSTVTPAVVGAAAAAGHDHLRVHRQPAVQLLVTGGELVSSGLPAHGRVRDALSPMLAPSLRACGARLTGQRLTGDEAAPLRGQLQHSAADVVITTGGTSVGPTDLLHEILSEVGARVIVDSVAVRPGHPMLLAELPPATDGIRRWLVGLPGNPLAAVAGMVTLAVPLLRRLGGHPQTAPDICAAATPIRGHAHDVRLVPVKVEAGRAAALAFDGSAMLRGIAAADGLAVVPPGGTAAGSSVEVLPLPR